MDKKLFCDHLRDKRENVLDKSLKDMEEKTGLSAGYLSTFERGYVDEPRGSVIRRIAKAYKVSFKEMKEAFYGSKESADEIIEQDIMLTQLESDEKLNMGELVRDAIKDGLSEKQKQLIIELYKFKFDDENNKKL